MILAHTPPFNLVTVTDMPQSHSSVAQGDHSLCAPYRDAERRDPFADLEGSRPFPEDGDRLPFKKRREENHSDQPNGHGALKEKGKIRSLKTNLVFRCRAHTPINKDNIRRAFNSAITNAKIEDFHFHDLRHTFATRLVQMGVDLY